MDHETWGMIKGVGKRETGAGGKHEVRGGKTSQARLPPHADLGQVLRDMFP